MTQRSPERARSAEGTRAAILEAARRVFTRDGYGVGLREVAAEADVNVALVIRYFGSKDELFAAALGNELDLAPLLEGPRRELGLRLARYAFGKPSSAHDPILILLRSAGHEPALARFRQLVDERFVEPVSRWLGGEHAEVRAALIAGELIGIAMLRDVVRSDALRGADHEVRVMLAARAIQAHVTPKR
ncbi:MAG: TetR/AcrR family transcriptional regulator [Myxococcales bacterium]|nr:TetR/AcrR family transcriptional regulator [Myxococcales bacterium]